MKIIFRTLPFDILSTTLQNLNSVASGVSYIKKFRFSFFLCCRKKKANDLYTYPFLHIDKNHSRICVWNCVSLISNNKMQFFSTHIFSHLLRRSHNLTYRRTFFVLNFSYFYYFCSRLQRHRVIRFSKHYLILLPFYHGP